MKPLLPIAPMTRRRILVATTLVSLAVLLAPPLEAQTAALLTPVAEPPPSIAVDPLTVRSRLVSLDLGQVQAARAAWAAPLGVSPRPGTRPGARTTPELGV